jgi:hypothetical protein
VVEDYQGRQLSGIVIRAMALVAKSVALAPLLAPVRPSWKDRYPTIAIERYAEWRGPDGLPFDPWMRLHSKLGATIVRAEPQSMEIVHPVAEWEA